MGELQMGCLCFCKNDIHPDRKECGFTKEWAPREPSDSEEEQEKVPTSIFDKSYSTKTSLTKLFDQNSNTRRSKRGEEKREKCPNRATERQRQNCRPTICAGRRSSKSPSWSNFASEPKSNPLSCFSTWWHRRRGANWWSNVAPTKTPLKYSKAETRWANSLSPARATRPRAWPIITHSENPATLWDAVCAKVGQ